MNKKINVLICGRFDSQIFNAIKSHPKFNAMLGAEQPTARELSECEALLIRSTTQVDKRILSLAPRLKFVITSTVGYEHLDLSLLTARNIRAFFCPHASTQSAAELTMTLLLSLAKKTPLAFHNIKAGHWRRDENRGFELANKTLGIVGFGRVGKRVAKMAQAFDMNVVAHDPYLEDKEFEDRNVKRLGLDELLKISDVITLHVPATKETSNLLHRVYLENTTESTILINTSRGSVVRLQEIKWALDHKKLGGVALDVFEHEPVRTDDWFLHDKRVVATPHIGATTNEALYLSSLEAYQLLIDVTDGKQVTGELPEAQLWAQGVFLGPKEHLD